MCKDEEKNGEDGGREVGRSEEDGGRVVCERVREKGSGKVRRTKVGRF
jgi:hypothetical protein